MMHLTKIFCYSSGMDESTFVMFNFSDATLMLLMDLGVSILNEKSVEMIRSFLKRRGSDDECLFLPRSSYVQITAIKRLKAIVHMSVGKFGLDRLKTFCDDVGLRWTWISEEMLSQQQYHPIVLFLKNYVHHSDLGSIARRAVSKVVTAARHMVKPMVMVNLFGA